MILYSIYKISVALRYLSDTGHAKDVAFHGERFSMLYGTVFELLTPSPKSPKVH